MDERRYRVDRRTVLGDWPLFLLAAVDVGAAIWAFPRLPAEAAVHWSTSGLADRYGGPWELALFWPLAAAATYLFLLFVPLMDPKQENYARFGRVYSFIRQGVPAVLLLLHLSQLASAVGLNISPLSVLLLSLSVLFLVTGLAMGRIQPNYFIGFRTPWTLANEQVWLRTHRFAGGVWVALSLLHALVLLLPLHLRFAASMGVLAVMVLVPVFYSYLVFRRANA